MEKLNNNGDAAIVSGGYKSAEVLKIFEIDSKRDLIIASGSSLHMYPNKNWFENFIELEGGHIILENNKTCKILGIGTIRLKMLNGLEYLLQNTKYIPELKKYI